MTKKVNFIKMMGAEGVWCPHPVQLFLSPCTECAITYDDSSHISVKYMPLFSYHIKNTWYISSIKCKFPIRFDKENTLQYLIEY